MAVSRSATARKRAALPIALPHDAEEVLWLLQKIRAVRNQLGANPRRTLREEWFLQKLRGLERDICAPDANLVHSLELLESYAVAVGLWPLADKRLKLSAKQSEAADETNKKLRENPKPKKPQRDFTIPHPLEPQVFELLKKCKFTDEVTGREASIRIVEKLKVVLKADKKLAAELKLLKDEISLGYLDKQILTPARLGRRIPTYPRLKRSDTYPANRS